MSEGKEKPTTFPVHCRECGKELRLDISWVLLAQTTPGELRVWRCKACGAADWIMYEADKALVEAHVAAAQALAADLGIVVSEARKSGTLTIDRRAAEAADPDVVLADTEATLYNLNKLIDEPPAEA